MRSLNLPIAVLCLRLDIPQELYMILGQMDLVRFQKSYETVNETCIPVVEESLSISFFDSSFFKENI